MIASEKGPERRCNNSKTPTSEFGDSACRSLRDIASLAASEIPASNVSQFALLGQHGCIGSNVRHAGSECTKVGIALEVRKLVIEPASGLVEKGLRVCQRAIRTCKFGDPSRGNVLVGRV